MSASGLEQEMYKYFTQLNIAEKKSVVNMIKTFLQTRVKPDQRISVEQYNKELEAAEKEIESGNFITQEDLEKEMDKW